MSKRQFVIGLAVCVLSLFAGAASPFWPMDAYAAEPSEVSDQELKQALADLLRDPDAREALIQKLEAPASTTESHDRATVDAQSLEAARPQSIGQALAETSQNIAEGILNRAVQLGRELKAAPKQFAGLRGDAGAVILKGIIDLALTIAATVGLFVVLRNIGKRLDRRLGARASEAGLIRKTALVFGSVLIDVVVVLASWAAGYVLALIVFGDAGSIGILQSLYLNAFLVVELVKVGVRTVLSPTTAELRPISIPDGAAKRLNIWLSIVVSVLGYGQLLVMPVVSEQVSWLAGQSVGAVISLAAVLLLVGLVLTYRRDVADWLLHARHMAEGPAVLRSIATGWHWPFLVYLAALFVIVLTRPGGILLPVLAASFQILAAIILGSVAANGISKSIAKGVRLPIGVNQRLPLLERRLNAFVPKALTLVRYIIVLAVLLFALEKIDVVEVEAWLVGQVGAHFTGMIVAVVFILFGAFAIWLAISSYIDFRLNPEFGSMPTAREKTLLSLGRNAVTIVLIAITLMFVLSEVGIDIAPLIASAGVLGLAIGFGAQKLVQDIITGVFIQFENAINVGDIIQVGGSTGVVERLTIRSVSLRDVHGIFHIIPFSTVDKVSNYTKDYSQYVCDMGVAYKEDIEVAKQAMLDAFAELWAMPAWAPFIMEDITWMGLQSFADSAVVLRARIKTTPGKHLGVGRAYNAIIKRIFDERGIEIPFPHQTIYFGETKAGTPPSNPLTERHNQNPPHAPMIETE